jgi:Ca2+-binding RTX toxin-like protein
MANTNVSTSSALRTTIQTAGTIDSITLEEVTPTSEPSGYSVLTLAKRSSFAAKKATPSGGYTIQGTSSNLADSALLINTRIYQQNVDGAYAPGSVKNLTLSYVLGGQADNGALLSVTSAASRSITLENILITGGHKGWNGNGNLYMSLRSFNAAAPLNTSLALTSVIVNLTGQNNSFTGTTGGSAFLHSWNNSGAVSITGSNFDEAGYASFFNLLTFGTATAGSYTLTSNTFRRTSNQTVRPEGNRLGSVVASLTDNIFQDGSYLDLYGNVGSVTLNSNTTIAGGYGIRVNDPVIGTPTLSGTNQFTGGGLALKFVKSGSGAYSITAGVTINSTSFDRMTAGGQSDDTITLASGDNWISGDLGNDTLTGGTGNDAFVFATSLNSTTNVDTITDFKATGAGTDKIWLARSVFTGLTAGTTLDATDFGTTAALGADVVYDSISKGLFFKAGGASNLSGYTRLATLGGTSTTSVGNGDFVLF